MRNHVRPLLARFCGKLVAEVAPAVLASVLGAFLVTQFVRPESPKPATLAAAPAGPEMLALLRDEHAVLAELVRRNTETMQAANRAADADAQVLRQAAIERAVRTAQAIDAAMPVRKPVSRVAGVTEKTAVEKVAGEPLELASLRNPAPVNDGAPRPPADLAVASPDSKSDVGFLRRQVRNAVATVERVPEIGRAHV